MAQCCQLISPFSDGPIRTILQASDVFHCRVTVVIHGIFINLLAFNRPIAEDIMADSSNGYWVEEGLIVIHRDLTALDLFLRDFLAVLKKYADYLVVSGFVSISTGRVRGTEDIDVLVPQLEKEEFSRLFDDLSKNGFWCY